MLLPKDYIRLLTGEYATDASDAAGTLLLDLDRRNWSHELLQTLRIAREWLPQVYEGLQVTGQIRAAMADELGLPRHPPVVAGGGGNRYSDHSRWRYQLLARHERYLPA